MESKFLISVNYSFSVITDTCCEHITGGVNIYLCEFSSLSVAECPVCLCHGCVSVSLSVYVSVCV